MFGLFKRKKPPISKELRDFQNSFTEKQKSAIIASSCLIATSHEEMSQNKKKIIWETIVALGTTLSSSTIHRMYVDNHDELVQTLNTLDETQKEWYIIVIHGVVTADGIIRDKEINYMILFAGSIGISMEKIVQILEHTELFINNKQKFMKQLFN